MKDVPAGQPEYPFQVRWQQHILVHDTLGEPRRILFYGIECVLDELSPRSLIPVLTSSEFSGSILYEHGRYQVSILVLVKRAVED
jgi:hypothetical protein